MNQHPDSSHPLSAGNEIDKEITYALNRAWKHKVANPVVSEDEKYYRESLEKLQCLLGEETITPVMLPSLIAASTATLAEKFSDLVPPTVCQVWAAILAKRALSEALEKLSPEEANNPTLRAEAIQKGIASAKYSAGSIVSYALRLGKTNYAGSASWAELPKSSDYDDRFSISTPYIPDSFNDFFSERGHSVPTSAMFYTPIEGGYGTRAFGCDVLSVARESLLNKLKELFKPSFGYVQSYTGLVRYCESYYIGKATFEKIEVKWHDPARFVYKKPPLLTYNEPSYRGRDLPFNTIKGEHATIKSAYTAVFSVTYTNRNLMSHIPTVTFKKINGVEQLFLRNFRANDFGFSEGKKEIYVTVNANSDYETNLVWDDVAVEKPCGRQLSPLPEYTLPQFPWSYNFTYLQKEAETDISFIGHPTSNILVKTIEYSHAEKVEFGYSVPSRAMYFVSMTGSIGTWSRVTHEYEHRLDRSLPGYANMFRPVFFGNDVFCVAVMALKQIIAKRIRPNFHSAATFDGPVRYNTSYTLARVNYKDYKVCYPYNSASLAEGCRLFFSVVFEKGELEYSNVTRFENISGVEHLFLNKPSLSDFKIETTAEDCVVDVGFNGNNNIVLAAIMVADNFENFVNKIAQSFPVDYSFNLTTQQEEPCRFVFPRMEISAVTDGNDSVEKLISDNLVVKKLAAQDASKTLNDLWSSAGSCEDYKGVPFNSSGLVNYSEMVEAISALGSSSDKELIADPLTCLESELIDLGDRLSVELTTGR